MRSGHLDYETGKWVDDLSPTAPVATQPVATPPVTDGPAIAPQPMAEPVPMSAADKARLMIQQRQGRP